MAYVHDTSVKGLACLQHCFGNVNNKDILLLINWTLFMEDFQVDICGYLWIFVMELGSISCFCYFYLPDIQNIFK